MAAYRDQHKPRVCIAERQSGQTPNMEVWGAIAYNMRSCFLLTQTNIKRNHYIKEVLESEVLPLLQATLTSRVSAGQCLATCDEDFSSLVWSTRGMGGSIVCTFTRHKVQQTSGILLVGNVFVMIIQQQFLSVVVSHVNVRGGFISETCRLPLIPGQDA